MICPTCGATLNDGAQFCTSCGARLASQPEEMKAPEPAAADTSVVCPQCGTPRSGSENFCTNCGSPLPAGTAAPQPQLQSSVNDRPQLAQVQEAPRPNAAPMFAEPSSPVQPNLSAAPANLKDFVQHFAADKTKKSMRNNGYFLYGLAALNLVFALIVGNLPLDALILAALGFWYQKTYSHKCSIVFLVYSILSIIVTSLATGSIGGWLILIVAILMFSGTMKAQKALEEYQKTGQPPVL
ncbi:MAG: zinc-ribbon domain-containing protein [Solobacterium sp.]|nr:zinc-ribbon domain-containing protein [Solobacterium sp.]